MDEWSILAKSYEEVLLPRFEPLYDRIAEIIIAHIASRETNPKWKILDFGTGPGEPILTIYKSIIQKRISNVEFYAADPSANMIQSAKERSERFAKESNHIEFYPIDRIPNDVHFDIITSSLVLPYASDQSQMLEELNGRLSSKSLLINAHWPHPSKVPFLTVLKSVGYFMDTEQHLDMTNFESDASFSCWNEEEFHNRLKNAGFTIEQIIDVRLPMKFPNARSLLSFCSAASWFADPCRYSEAEHELKRILHTVHQIEIELGASFELPSQVTVIVASTK